jgi:hypothetical protein
MKYKMNNAVKENDNEENDTETVRVRKWKEATLSLIYFINKFLPNVTARAVADAVNIGPVDKVYDLKNGKFARERREEIEKRLNAIKIEE